MVNFLPFASPKNSNKQKLVSNIFNQSYSSESNISTYWLYAIPSMFNMLFVLSYLWMKMFMLLIAMKKIGYIALTDLMHNVLFFA